jgi:predicted GH43/DUF377 family glycosyl hydrolase
LAFEPGKFLVSEAGFFLTKVNVVKQTTSTVFASIDSGFNHLIRPMLYGSQHHIENISNHIVLDPKGIYEVNYVGVGCAPIETKEGWLLIYFGAQETTSVVRYHIKGALLDIDNPKRIISRLRKPLFSPQKLLWEKSRMTEMVFPTGHALLGNDLYIYYSLANKFIAVASLKINELLDDLRSL